MCTRRSEPVFGREFAPRVAKALGCDASHAVMLPIPFSADDSFAKEQMPEHSDAPAARSLGDLLDDRASRAGELAVLSHEGAALSLRDVAEQSRRVAGGLRALGVGHGDRVAIWMPNCPEWIVAFVACARLGAIAVALNTRFRTRELSDLLGRSGAKVLFYWPGYRDVDFTTMLSEIGSDALPGLRSLVACHGMPNDVELQGHRWTVHAYESVAAAPPLDSDVGVASDGCVIFTTSGTTSKPKLVLHRQCSLSRHGGDVTCAFGLDRDGAVILLPTPLSGVLGLTVAVSAIAAGRSLVLMDRFDPHRAADLIDRHRVTHIGFVADMLARLLEIRPGRHSFATLRLGIGARKGHAAQAQAHGIRLVGTYGMSELLAWLTFRDPSLPPDVRELGGGTLVAPEARVRARHPETGQLVPHNAPGELEIRAPSMLAAYFGDESATRGAFTDDGFFRTGDLGYTTDERSFVYLSRMGDAIRLDGWLVNPAEIEATVTEHPDVLSSQVVGVEVDSRMRPVAFVVVRSGRSFDEAAIIEHCNARSARYKAPCRVFLLEGFPVTESPNGVKVQKGRLREMALQRLSRAAN